jgi:hypothetical protein
MGELPVGHPIADIGRTAHDDDGRLADVILAEGGGLNLLPP